RSNLSLFPVVTSLCFFTALSSTYLYSLSLHDALPILILFIVVIRALAIHRLPKTTFLALWMIAALRLLLPFSIPLTFNIHIGLRSEEHTSELQSRFDLVCRLLLENKNTHTINANTRST